ncbi:hypothetical protein J723_4128 [Acinetobacter sp. 1264765]|nr:hypothetical protein J723_4128 [Acinetobacter sp. 1264765]
MSEVKKPHTESKATKVVAWCLIIFGIVLGIAFILSYGQVETALLHKAFEGKVFLSC